VLKQGNRRLARAALNAPRLFLRAAARRVRQFFGISLARSIGGDLATVLFLSFIAAFMALPLVYVFVNAFKPPDELFLFPPRFFVQNPTLENFSDFAALIENSWVPFSRYAFNSAFTTSAATAAHVVFASMAAYVLEKHRFPGRRLFFSVVILSLMFSSEVLFVPRMLVMNSIGWMDTYWAIIVPAAGMPIGLFLIKQFMASVPDSLLESAKIDGANEMYIFWNIVMPLIKPAWLTALIFCSQQIWNNTSGAPFIRAEQLKPIPQAMSRILDGGIGRWGSGAVVSLFMVSVPITVFIIAQANILDTMTASGLKE
jgi:ABC-type glycerol-3-phosphate transport system permease component